MHDAFTRAASRDTLSHRKLKDKNAYRFSPSYGVHKGMIPDPNWPPARFPEDSTAMARVHRRVPARFKVESDGKVYEVKGDMSKGGAMFMLPTKLDVQTVEVRLGDLAARAQLLAAHEKGAEVSHHVRFLDEGEATALWTVAKKS